MTLSEQIDKFANETRDTVDIICRIAKRQGKEEALDVIEDIREEIEHEGAMFPDGEFFVSIDRINEIIDKYKEDKE